MLFYLDSSNKFDMEFLEFFKLSLLFKDMIILLKIIEFFFDICKLFFYLESSVKMDLWLFENF